MRRTARRREERALEHHVARRRRDLARLAAHDARQRDGAARVGDHQVVRHQRALDPVERHDALARRRAAHDDGAVRDPRQVERVQRLTVLEHREIGGVDDGVDGTHPAAQQAQAHRERRRTHAHAAHHPRHVPRTEVRRLDPHPDLLGAGRAALAHARPRRTRAHTQHGGQVAGDAADGQQIAAVRGHLDLDHRVVHARQVAQGHARRRLGQLERARRLVAQLEVGLGAQHAVGCHALHLDGLDVTAVGQRRAGKSDRDTPSSREPGRGGHDAAGLAAQIEPADRQPRGRGMRGDGLEPRRTDLRVEVAHLLHRLDLQAGHRHAIGEGRGGVLPRDELGKPAERNAHDDVPAAQNCARKRRSSS